jgi:hypothetical protein
MRGIIILLALGFFGCAVQSGGTSTGNPVTLNISPFNSSLALGKLGDAGALAVTDLRFCFKRLRFKAASDPTSSDSSQDSSNIDLNLGEVRISELGTNLGEVKVPAGTYGRVEFDLEDSCSGNSLRLTNGNGTFQTSSRISIRFNGSLVVSGTQSVNLNIQSIISALNTAASNSDLKTKAEGASGSL